MVSMRGQWTISPMDDLAEGDSPPAEVPSQAAGTDGGVAFLCACVGRGCEFD